jgi:hypothetical protein
MEPKPQAKNAGETGRSENGDNQKSESNGGEN